jgi:adenylyl-sulfate kinase
MLTYFFCSMAQQFPRWWFVLWFTGLSGAGKSTLAQKVQTSLQSKGYDTIELLDGDSVREWLSKDLWFSRQDRITHIARVGYVAKLLSRNGVATLGAFISPYREMRDALRRECTNFIEVYVSTSQETCESRDTKWLYAKAKRGEILEFTGVSDTYEPPLHPEIILDTDNETPDMSWERIIAYLREHEFIR